MYGHYPGITALS